MKKKLSGAETALEKRVQKIINGYAEDYENGAKGFLEDLQQGGCQSGMVGELVYYTDTIRFYKNYKDEISILVRDMIGETGESLNSIFKRIGWEDDDPLALSDVNQNILAWFGFEETAFNLARKNNIEI